jgi:hypothetical protein
MLQVPATFRADIKDMLQANDLSVQFALGGSGSGLTFHRHADAFLSLVHGVKRW